MDLASLGINENRIKQLEKRNLKTVEDIQRFFPRRYYDYSSKAILRPENAGRHAAVVGTLLSVSARKTNKTLMVTAKVFEPEAEKILNIIWIGHYYIYKSIKFWLKETVIACGELDYNEEYHSFHMKNPVIFDKQIDKNLRIYPVYKKMTGISAEFMQQLIDASLGVLTDDPLPADILNRYHLMPLADALNALHHPAQIEDVKKARKRFVYEQMLSFALRLETDSRNLSKGSIYNIKSVKSVQEYVRHLPYELTKSQKDVFAIMKETAYNGIRINSLIQGDVGSGKTVMAILMMLAMADSGYQSVLMAPTVVLAAQHYQAVADAADRFGYKTAFLTADLKAKEKKRLLQGIETGEYQFIVGTHSVMGNNIVYKNLALVVIDEEHKFGVKQRDLISNTCYGTHKISMSATPIPRTIAETIYGRNVSVYNLELPAARKTIQTAVFNNDRKIYEFIEKKILRENQQAYVVCPFIDDPDEKTNVQTTEKTSEAYRTYFEPLGIRVENVTGKLKSAEAEEILRRFRNGETQILIATSIIEVGVNVPNANIIVINNAERFGLAQLHQLRGRVGRGSAQGYCILKSSDRDNPKLEIMCRTSNGFEISREDMKLRGTGDILGTDQSGKNDDINLILSYPNMYQYCKKDAADLADLGVKPW